MRATVCTALFLSALAATGCSHTRIAVVSLPVPPSVEHDDHDEEREGTSTGALEWFLSRRVGKGATELPAEKYAAAREHVAHMPRYSVAHGAVSGDAGAVAHAWTSLGIGNFGGRTRSFLINPKNPNIMYAGATTGGVWKSSDGGASWSSVTDSFSVLSIGALAMDPSNPSVIYAGTGESAAGHLGNGIFKSADAGVTWTVLGKPAAAGAFNYIERLAVSPANPLHLYAATHAGLYMSKDGGATWSSSLIAAAFFGCTDLTIRADKATDYVFSVCSGNTAGDFAVWRNTDAAGTGVWSNVFTTPKMGGSLIALAPSQPSTIYLAVLLPTGGNYRDVGGLIGVYRSVSNGDAGSWTMQVSGQDGNPWHMLLLSYASLATSWCTTGGKYTGDTPGVWARLLAVDPLDPNRVWIGGPDLYRSDDGGVNWGLASALNLESLPSYSPADRHLMVFHPGYDGAQNQTIFQLNDEGIWRSDNARAPVSTGTRAGCQADFTNNNQVVWQDANHGYNVTQLFHGFPYPGGTAYIAGGQDQGASRGADAAGIDGWVKLYSGDGAGLFVDPADANQLFVSATGLTLERATNGSRFQPAVSGITEPAGDFPFWPELIADPNDGRRLFLGGGNILWRSLDQGTNWTAAGTVEKGGQVSAIAVSPFDSNTVFAGTNQGYIYQSNDALNAGQATPWKPVQPRTGSVASIAFDPINPQVMYAVYSTMKTSPTQAHVYRSADGGKNWPPSDGSGATAVPDAGTWSLVVDPYTNTTVYLGTDFGVLVSTDSGATWARDPGLPSVYTERLTIDATNSWLFAFTNGRGANKTPLPGAPRLNCTFAVDQTEIDVDGYGGIFPVNVSAPDGCVWVAYPTYSNVAEFGSITNNTSVSIQSPAQGSGNSTAFVSLPPNLLASAQTTPLTIAGNPVLVRQAVSVFNFSISDTVDKAPVITVPYMVHADTRTATSAAGDPVHSCTGSADYKTVWWQFTQANDGYVNVFARGDRYDVAGSFGIVVTAYPQSDLTQELACATVPKSTTQVPTSIQFWASGGVTYLIEISTQGGNAAQDGGLASLVVTNGTGPVAVTVSPSAATVSPGGGPLQFAAEVDNTQNTAVRWSVSPPIGIVSLTGVYTPPASLAAATTVTVTATSFADPTQSSSAAVTIQP
jgi:hypothetical protein